MERELVTSFLFHTLLAASFFSTQSPRGEESAPSCIPSSEASAV
jgi:hypothetical protein